MFFLASSLLVEHGSRGTGNDSFASITGFNVQDFIFQGVAKQEGPENGPLTRFEPDDGIWEMRSVRQQNTHSKIMCWVALDRALRLSDNLDAATLLMPMMKFISPTDPMMLSTLDAIRSELVSDSQVHRYRSDAGLDGLHGTEGTFSMSTFWLVECLTRAGKPDESRLIFKRMLGYGNHLGLYGEEIGRSGETLGNLPQAVTHLGLISAAYNLDRALDGRK